MPTAFGLTHVWSQGDLVTRLIFICLLLMSVVSWTVIVLKALDVWRHKRSALQSEQFWYANSLTEGLSLIHI